MRSHPRSNLQVEPGRIFEHARGGVPLCLWPKARGVKSCEAQLGSRFKKGPLGSPEIAMSAKICEDAKNGQGTVAVYILNFGLKRLKTKKDGAFSKFDFRKVCQDLVTWGPWG